jgi:predicted HTH domain antitoxin
MEAGMTVWAFQQLLGSREIPVHYGLDDYEADLSALKELGQP